MSKKERDWIDEQGGGKRASKSKAKGFKRKVACRAKLNPSKLSGLDCLRR